VSDVDAARLKLGLEAPQLQDLRNFLSGRTFGREIPCDHTHARTEEWAGRMSLDVEAVVEAVKAFGGACDCAVVAKVTPDRFGWPA